MKRNINIKAALFLCSLWVSYIDASQQPLPAELSFVDTSSTASTQNTLMGSVENPVASNQQNVSQAATQNTVQQPEQIKSTQKKDAHILYQPKVMNDEEVYLNFEDVDLLSVASYMENLHNVTFITDDIITTSTKSSTKAASSLQGHKVSFRMFKAVTKRQSWNLFITFLKMAGLDLVPMAKTGFYKIVSFAESLNEALPTYIGVDRETLPENDTMIRYIYFLQNSDVATVQPLITQLQGSVGKVETYPDLKALIFIDRAYNIRSLMNVVIELDRAVEPQVVSVIKLKRALADDVISLYKSLKPTETSSERAWAPVKKKSSLQYFPSDVILVSDKRTNSLIVLGTEKSVTRIENFIRKHVDEEIDYRDNPVNVYRLEYTNAGDIKKILDSVVGYGSTTTKKYGGVLNGEKYFSPMTIVADQKTNSLIINAKKQDYSSIKRLIKKLDIPQKQIAFDFLLLQVSNVDTRTIGSQIAGSTTDIEGTTKGTASTFLNNISAQTSGIPPASNVVHTDNSIKSSLASLISGSTINTAGSTLITFGKSIWGLLKIVKQIGSTQIIANPFLVTTNNTEGKVTMGKTRRVKTSDVYSASTVTASGYKDREASLEVTITPQVNEDNIINLALTIKNDEFTVATDSSNPTTNNKKIVTTASLAAGEVLVLGGIVTETISSASVGVPVLEKIPVLGWLFKSKTKKIEKDHFVVFIAPRILDPLGDSEMTGTYTKEKIEEAHEYLNLMNDLDLGSVRKDPISKAFFGQNSNSNTIHLFEEDAVAFQEDKDNKNALMKRVYDEERLSKKKRRRRKNSKIETTKKRSRRKKRFKEVQPEDSNEGSNRYRRKKNKKKEKLKKLVGNKNIKKNQGEEEVMFIENAFPLNADKLETKSMYDIISADQGGFDA